MKKSILILSSLFLTLIMQGQTIPQPKPGPSPTIKIGKPETFELKNGLKVLVVENHKLPRVSFSLTLDNDPYAEGNKKGVADLTGSLMGNGTKTISKTAFNEEIDFMGASLNFGSDRAFASSLSKYAGRVLELLADGALHPNFTQEEFDKEKAKLIEGIKTSEKSVPAVAGRVKGVLTYGVEHPSGEYLSEATINNVTLEDVILNYNTYFVPGNAYLIITGDVKFKDVKKLVEKYFGSWKKATAPSRTYTDPKDVQYTQINFVDMPNAVQSEVATVNMVNLKMTDPDYYAALVANQILGGDFNSYINMNLREAHGWTYGARSSIYGDKRIATFEASTQVRNAVTDSTVVEIFKELKKIKTEKVSDEMLANVKAGYIGRFVMNVDKPQTVANFALRIQTQGLPADFYENYISNINAVTADDVLRVANKYFLADNTRIVVVGKASEVVPNLEKLKIPIFYFDKYGKPTAKPSLNKPVPAGVTAKTVFDNYIKAVGGETAIKNVKTLFTTAQGTVQGIAITMVNKSNATGKSLTEVTGMGQTFSKSVFDGKKGYQSAQGQKKELTAEEIQNEKFYANPFPELALADKPGVVVTGIETVDNKEAYAVKDDKKTLYYDTKTGLKIGEAQTQEVQGKPLTQLIIFSDYKEVKGVKVPHKTTMNVGIDIELKTSDVKINEGVSDADYQ